MRVYPHAWTIRLRSLSPRVVVSSRRRSDLHGSAFQERKRPRSTERMQTDFEPFVDVRFGQAVETDFASRELGQLLWLQRRNDEPVRNVDAKLITAQPPGRMARESCDKTKLHPRVGNYFLELAPGHAAVNQSVAIPYCIYSRGDRRHL
jgi:hypothetical protein